MRGDSIAVTDVMFGILKVGSRSKWESEVQYMLDSRPSLATVTQTTVVPTDTRVEREVLRIFHVEDELKPDLADLFDEEGVLNGSLPWFAVGFGIDILAVSDDLGALLRELQAKGHKLVIDHKTE